MLLRKLKILAVTEMSRRKVGILSFYASSSLSEASIHSGLERHKNITVCCIVFWTLLNPGIDAFSQPRKITH